MNDLLLHPTTDHQLHALIQSPPQAVLISGPAGSGKRTVANSLFRSLIGKEPYLLEIEPLEGSIGIDAIRNIKDFLARRTTGKNTIRRAVVIYDAQLMSVEAQNSLLKTLEEPPTDTLFVLTVNDPLNLRPTIRSRTQQLRILPINLEVASKHFASKGLDRRAIERVFYISEGRVGLMQALADKTDDHELVLAVNQAKKILRMDAHERLVLVDELSKDKAAVLVLLDGIERVISSGLRLSAQKNRQADTKRFYNLSILINRAQQSLALNTNTKLVLTDLFLNM